ncbi:hypothetical protein GCM10007384_00830 [Aquimarina muelleri]|uniref:Uncharacterized protein n=1 Tax=Aquimarina muelleri TaxID=279356 RepID=A0A918JSM5_9FLAO|nr:hypothetical protein GCM10007384_00830 [Aquimarina muelleri]
MSMEFLNFCLLRREDGSRVLKIPKTILDPDTQICLDIEINSKPLTIGLGEQLKKSFDQVNSFK